ncbi:hypothetical protein BN970_03269 [Mycolicibacterium conceptionense]|uniref:Uncharacterized protein n=1 Tax=Mycolicibacterium conceptionense TaxID=451644 RepID=A0A0U1DG31_9MYCO|nr:hypothetical protein BN970_03269 [Mycolicibacterium conceptionense]
MPVEQFPNLGNESLGQFFQRALRQFHTDDAAPITDSNCSFS